MDFDKFSTKVTSQAVKAELESYLEEKLMPCVSNLNILDYWRTHEIRYPTLARMARDILAIPISMVASESAFSIGGRVLDAYRSSLKPFYRGYYLSKRLGIRRSKQMTSSSNLSPTPERMPMKLQIAIVQKGKRDRPTDTRVETDDGQEGNPLEKDRSGRK